MYYSKLAKSSTHSGPGIRCTLYVSGCRNKCPGCQNPETWSYDGGYEFTSDTLNEIVEGIKKNGIQRNFCVLGGEPLCDENIFLTYLVIDHVRKAYPNIHIYVWTGYTYEELMERHNHRLTDILATIDVLIDGPYIEKERELFKNMIK